MQYHVNCSGKMTWPTLLATKFSEEEKKIECGWKHELSSLNLPQLSGSGKLVNVESGKNEDLNTLSERCVILKFVEILTFGYSVTLDKQHFKFEVVMTSYQM